MERRLGRPVCRAGTNNRRSPGAHRYDPRSVHRCTRRAAPRTGAHLLSRGATGVSCEIVPGPGVEEPEYSVGEIRRGEPEPWTSGSRLARREDCRGYRAAWIETGESSLTRSTDPC